MAIGDLVEYTTRIGLAGTTTRTGIDIGQGRIATSTTSGGLSRTITSPRPRGARTIARAGSARAMSAASNLWANPTTYLNGLRSRRASSSSASRTSGS
jgi:hypothetical protein